jgi:hypothetical protein
MMNTDSTVMDKTDLQRQATWDALRVLAQAAVVFTGNEPVITAIKNKMCDLTLRLERLRHGSGTSSPSHPGTRQAA